MTTNRVMGGTAWLSLSHKDKRVEKTFSLWCNSIYGMLVHWSRGQRQDPGRARIQVGGVKQIPVPSFDKILTGQQLDYMATEFDRISKLELKPAYMAREDDTRGLINAAVSKVFCIDGYDTDGITEIWCAEPSVKGKKQGAGANS